MAGKWGIRIERNPIRSMPIDPASRFARSRRFRILCDESLKRSTEVVIGKHCRWIRLPDWIAEKQSGGTGLVDACHRCRRVTYDKILSPIAIEVAGISHRSELVHHRKTEARHLNDNVSLFDQIEIRWPLCTWSPHQQIQSANAG